MATLDSVLTIKLSVEDRTRWDLLLGAIERLQATIEPTPEDPELVQHQIPESTGTVARCGAAFVDRGLAVNCAECKRLYRRWYDSKASRLEDQPDPHGAVPPPFSIRSERRPRTRRTAASAITRAPVRRPSPPCCPTAHENQHHDPDAGREADGPPRALPPVSTAIALRRGDRAGPAG